LPIALIYLLAFSRSSTELADKPEKNESRTPGKGDFLFQSVSPTIDIEGGDMHKKVALAAVIGLVVAGCASQQTSEPQAAAEPAAAKPAAPAAAAKPKPAPATQTGASAAMLANTCAGCHGTNGASGGPATPTISGLSEDYFVETMQAYKSGDRWSTIMGRIATGYSDEEIGAMAKHYASLPFTGKAQTGVGPKAKAGHALHEEYCEKCHEDEGRSIEDDSGLLAGQWMPYVHWTLDDFISGKSQASEKGMRKALKEMLKEHGPSSAENLANYYGSRK
jgi:sulfide dehydrogenase cytochrome subunit